MKIYIRKFISLIVAAAFCLSLVTPLPSAQAQNALNIGAPLVPIIQPVLIKGLTIHPDDPLVFDFIIHPGDQTLEADQFKKESQKLIKYFMASLTVPEKDMWVNLSPTEKNRIIPDQFGRTEMGRDLLTEDYFLKKFTASLLSPDNELGKKLWERIYTQSKEKFGTTDIPMDLLNKVWIVPESAKIYENGTSVFVARAHLKVLMEEEYLSQQPSAISYQKTEDSGLKAESQKIVKEILIPAIEHEVNNGSTFANLRQIYNAVILAAWYKQNLKMSLLGKVYVDQGKTKGVAHNDPKAKEKIYQKYLEAFQKGADSIQEEYDPTTQEVVTRKYISGGLDLAQMSDRVEKTSADGLPEALQGAVTERVQIAKVGDAAMIGELKIIDLLEHEPNFFANQAELGPNLSKSIFEVTELLGVEIHTTDKPKILIVGGTAQEVDFLFEKYPQAQEIVIVNVNYEKLRAIQSVYRSNPDLAGRLKLYRADARELNKDLFPDESFDFVYANAIELDTFGDINEEAIGMLSKIIKEEVRLVRKGGTIYHRARLDGKLEDIRDYLDKDRKSVLEPFGYKESSGGQVFYRKRIDRAMTADAQEEELTKDIEKIILEKGGNISFLKLRKALMLKREGERISQKRFESALLRLFQKMPKTIIHEHVSGVIFPEDLIRYYLDDEPLTYSFSTDELRKRKEKRQEARRRFVLTITSRRSGIDLQANPVNPDDIGQDDADRAFKEIFFEGIEGLPENLDLTYDALVKEKIVKQVVKKLKTFVTYKERNVDWNRFERTFAVIKTVTDSHPRFRYELLRKGVLKHFYQDNVNNLELTDFHSRSLGELIKELVSIEEELGGKMTISVLKAFRKDYLERVIKMAEQNAEYRQSIFQPYQGRSLKEVADMILDETIAMDKRYFKLGKDKVKTEFEEALAQIKDNLELEKGGQVTTEDTRIRLIYAFEARKLALKEAKDFEGDLNKLELQDPLLRKRIGGISSVGIETGYINWIGSPILRNARRIGLKVSSHMGEVWEPEKNVMSLKRIKNEIEIGVNRIAHVTVLGLNYDKSTRTKISSESDRAEAQQLQEEIFRLIRRNNIHVELQPTSQVVTSADFDEYKDHIITKFFGMNEGGKKISFSINPDDSSVFDTSPSQEELEIWKANPDISYYTFNDMREMANNARFYESPKRVKERFAEEREKVLEAIRGFNQYRKRLAVVVFGSARIPDGGEQQKIAEEISQLAWTYQVAVKTGGGPAVMKWVLAEFVRLRDKHYSELRRQGKAVPRKFSAQSINILLNSFEPANEFLEQNYDFRHFVFRKMGLYSNSRGFIALHGGLGTIDEIFEAWRRDRRVSTVGTDFYQPFFNVLRERWTAAGMADRIYYWPLVTDDTKEAFDHVMEDKRKVVNPTEQDTKRAIKEMIDGVDTLSKLPRAVVVLGKPEDNAYGQNLLDQLNNVIEPILGMNVPVRVVSRGLVLDAVLKKARKLGAESNLQAVLNRKEDGTEIDANEQYLQRYLSERTLMLEDDSNHQLLETYDARGYIVVPGGIGTLNKLFDLVVAMQTKSIRRKPIVLIGRDFWEPILNILKEKLEDYQPPLITKGDLNLMTIVDQPEEAMEELALNGITNGADEAIINSPEEEAPGGIDLNPGKIRFEASGNTIDFNLPLNDALIQEYLNVEGLEPIIINITPITNIPLLLGTAEPALEDKFLTKI